VAGFGIHYRIFDSSVVENKMQVVVGSTNQVKLRATRRAFEARYDLMRGEHVALMQTSVSSGVPEQPRGLDETVLGAFNRATACLEFMGDYTVGIESGVIQLQVVGSNIALDCCACVIFEVATMQYTLGISSAWAMPSYIQQQFAQLSATETLDDAMQRSGLSSISNLGSSIGAIGILSGGQLTREDYTVEAVRNALISLKPRLG
jgi:inosine/xanthosine triphosphatase